MSVKIAKYIGFCVCRRSYLIPGMPPRTSINAQIKYQVKRRSTIEVHPSFSEAPHHLRSSIPHAKTYFIQQKSNCIATKNPMAQVYKTFFFRNQDWGEGIPCFRNKIAVMCYLDRRTGLKNTPHEPRDLPEWTSVPCL